MSYWYRPNVFRRRWGSYGSIKNNWYSNNYSLNSINDNYDPDAGDEEYTEEDDVDLHPNVYTENSYFDPDNEPERANKPDIIDEEYNKTEESMFDDPDYEEYNKEFRNIIEPHEEQEYEEDEEQQEQDIPEEETITYEIVNPNNQEQVLTYDDNTLKILDGIIDIDNENELIDTLTRVEEDVRKRNETILLQTEQEDETIPVIITDKQNNIVLADNIEENRIPEVLQQLKEKPLQEEIEIHKDVKDPDNFIIPPKQYKEIKPMDDDEEDEKNRKRYRKLDDFFNDNYKKRGDDSSSDSEDNREDGKGKIKYQAKRPFEEKLTSTFFNPPRINNLPPQQPIQEIVPYQQMIIKPEQKKKKKSPKKIQNNDDVNGNKPDDDSKGIKIKLNELEERELVLKEAKPVPDFIPLESVDIPNEVENEEPILEDDEQELEWYDDHMPEEIKLDPVPEDAKYWHNFKHNSEKKKINYPIQLVDDRTQGNLARQAKESRKLQRKTRKQEKIKKMKDPINKITEINKFVNKKIKKYLKRHPLLIEEEIPEELIERWQEEALHDYDYRLLMLESEVIIIQQPPSTKRKEPIEEKEQKEEKPEIEKEENDYPLNLIIEEDSEAEIPIEPVEPLEDPQFDYATSTIGGEDKVRTR
ncbi:hypothetical protein, conserved [Entamoeba dispar SAW760]|uniref:Uncharacterized protein n=1 Tax=Entamoeba dispar (strain ATCC PRA-260 / SAW760) TaxID=370354 RepID=B0ELA8_ENTDS|nr:uncharacterized protein EDI_041560 [Entamoeba dispar SAW760]EDR24690.1 hypothetical protein, conserved [Entamoeba dispar SAW760]|eukprot:EDR24690.1 hypothetical protein, conserved [Entamoeba dispar SAW760]